MKLLAATSGSILLAVAFLAAGEASAEDVATPVYHQLLKLPTQSDRIGYPGSIVADLNTNEIFVADIRNRRIALFDQRGMFCTRLRAPRSSPRRGTWGSTRTGTFFLRLSSETARVWPGWTSMAFSSRAFHCPGH